MKHQVEIIEILKITDEVQILAIEQPAENFSVGDLINEKYIVQATDGFKRTLTPSVYSNKCGLIVKKF